MALIEKKDIISQDAEQPLDRLIQQFTEANNAFKELTVSSKALQQALNGVNKENSGDEAKKLIAINAQLIQTNKELEAVQKTILTTSTELQRIQQKRVAASTETAKQIAAEKVELQNMNRELTTNAKIQSSTTSAMQKYKLELRELKGVLLTAAAGTKEYNEALKRAAFLTDELGDMQARVKGTAMDFEGVMSNVVKVTSGAASAFEATQGAMALFGAESEDMQKAMLKVQAAIALANGLQGLDGFGKSLKNLGTQIKTWAASVKTSLLSTGIGAVVVALGLIIANWDKIKQAMTGVGGAQVRLNELAKENLKVQELNTRSIEASDALLRAQGKTERQIIELKKQAVKAELIKAEIALDSQRRINKAQIEAESRNLMLMKSLMDPVRAMLEVIEKTIAKLGAFVGKKWDLGLTKSFDELNTWFSKGFFDPEEMKKKFDAEDAEAQIHVKELWGKYLTLNENLKELNKKEVADYKEKIDQKKKLDEENEKRLNDIEESFFDNLREKAEAELKEKEELDKKIAEEDEAALAKAKERHDKFLQNKIDEEEKAAKIIADKKKEIAETTEKQAIDFASDIFGQYQDEKVNDIQENAKIEEDLLKNKLDKGLITEEQYNSELKKIRSNAKTEEAKAEKKKALFDIAINTAVAAVKALPNWVLSLFVVAQGAIQAAFVAAKPIPKYAKGGKIKGPSHSDGGVLIEAEGNEFMVNKNDALKAPKTLDLINKGLLSDKEILSKKDVNLDYLIVAQLKKNNRINEKVLTAVSNGVYTYEVNGVRHIVFADGSRVMNEFPRKKE